MKGKNLLTLALLVLVTGLVGGCHYDLIDGYRDYSGYDSYREGFRDGRAYERRRDPQTYSRYRYDYSRDRW